jgi:hypothetical protein
MTAGVIGKRVFTQQRVLTMQSYHLVQRGPVFTEDIEISLEHATGKYRVKTKARKDGREERGPPGSGGPGSHTSPSLPCTPAATRTCGTR